MRWKYKVLEYIGEMERFIRNSSRDETNRDTKVKCEVLVQLSLSLSKHNAMKTYGFIGPRIFNLSTRWR
jgi:hypothetical protein